MTDTPRPLLGLAITTIGRPALAALLRSAAESSEPPAAVVIANQSGAPLDVDVSGYPFPVTIVASRGGASAGRNDAAKALPADISIVAFPNDDSIYPTTALEAVVDRFAADTAPAALACGFRTGLQDSRALPPAGTDLDRYTIWRVIEWAMFVERTAFQDNGGFRADLGTGAPSPWQSGEGTDLLLRLLAQGRRIESAPGIQVFGPGERRDLTTAEFIAKHRKYARGTGHVYRSFPYPLHVRLRILIAPWLRLHTFHVPLPVALRIAFARSLGRVEGLLEHPFGTRRRSS